MGERREGGDGNPLVSGRGVTSVKDVVVQRIAGLAAQEVEGVHMGGGAARTASWLTGGRGGSQEHTRGVSVDVGRTEVAIDLTMAIDYGNDILQTVNRVRDRISARVQPLTGLSITELNVTVSDVLLPDDRESKREDDGGAADGIEGDDADETRRLPSSELRPGARERGYTEVEPTDREHVESQSGPVPEEDVSVREAPLAADQTAELRLGKEGTQERRRSTGEDETEGPRTARGPGAADREGTRGSEEPEAPHRGPLAEEEDVDRTSEIDLQKKDDEEKSG